MQLKSSLCELEYQSDLRVNGFLQACLRSWYTGTVLVGGALVVGALTDAHSETNSAIPQFEVCTLHGDSPHAVHQFMIII
jgi:hypothetical protein